MMVKLKIFRKINKYIEKPQQLWQVLNNIFCYGSHSHRLFLLQNELFIFIELFIQISR